MTDWALRAACRGHPSAWWWYSPDPTAVALACRVCSRCPVQGPCLAEAVELGDEYGVRAGLTAGQRARLATSQPTLRHTPLRAVPAPVLAP
jgi:hypothetical protein